MILEPLSTNTTADIRPINHSDIVVTNVSLMFEVILWHISCPTVQNYKKGVFDSQPQVIKFTSCLSMVGGSLRYPFKIVLKYIKNNLRRPFENCEFTPLFYRITCSFFIVMYHKRKTTCIRLLHPCLAPSIF